MPLQFGLLLYPNLTQLDLTGPFEVFARVPDAQVHLIWKNREPVQADSGLRLLPTTVLEECPALDVVCVPGGPGQIDLMEDEEVHQFLCGQAETCRYVTSVCTGSLVLGAAGLLKGYKATTYWAAMDLLPAYGAEPVNKRVVIDRNRITGGGVTAGIDFGLALVAELLGERVAKMIQLGLEYKPAPPFNSGHPDVAEPEITEALRALMLARIQERRKQANNAA